MDIPGLGTMTHDEDLDLHYSSPVAAAALGGATGQVVVTDGYVIDTAKDDFHAAVAAFLANDDSALRAEAPEIFAYYRDTARFVREHYDDVAIPEITAADEVREHVRIGDEFHVDRDQGDGRVYVSVECECSWEPEHGLQIVFRGGHTVSKVGPVDDALTNGSATSVYVSPDPA